MGFSRQEYWSGLPLPSPGDLPDPGIKPGSPSLQADSSQLSPGITYVAFKKKEDKIFGGNCTMYLGFTGGSGVKNLPSVKETPV